MIKSKNHKGENPFSILIYIILGAIILLVGAFLILNLSEKSNENIEVIGNVTNNTLNDFLDIQP